MKGKLISVSGIDGSGKSTLLKKIGNCYLNDRVIIMEGFGNREFTKELDFIAGEKKLLKNEYFSDNLINIAWMCDLISNVILNVEPNLDAGNNIILDRYILSAQVYSLATTDYDISYLFKLYNMLPTPDLCVYLDVEVNCALDRISRRKKDRSYYETFKGLKKIKSMYERLIKETTYPLVKIDANMDEKRVFNEAINYIDKIVAHDIGLKKQYR